MCVVGIRANVTFQQRRHRNAKAFRNIRETLRVIDGQIRRAGVEIEPPSPDGIGKRSAVSGENASAFCRETEFAESHVRRSRFRKFNVAARRPALPARRDGNGDDSQQRNRSPSHADTSDVNGRRTGMRLGREAHNAVLTHLPSFSKEM